MLQVPGWNSEDISIISQTIYLLGRSSQCIPYFIYSVPFTSDTYVISELLNVSLWCTCNVQSQRISHINFTPTFIKNVSVAMLPCCLIMKICRLGSLVMSNWTHILLRGSSGVVVKHFTCKARDPLHFISEIGYLLTQSHGITEMI